MPPGGAAVPGTAPVREAHRFDVPALERYLAARLPGFAGPLEVRQFLGGQSNPTYHLRAPSGEYVLRRKPPGKLLPSAHAVEREFRVIAALQGTGVHVHEALVLCEDAGVVGTAFYVMRYVAGRVLPELGLPGLAPGERRALWDDAVGVLARLHQVDWRVAGLADFGRPGNYYARQIHRWVGQ
jgi:aminoglycoside phosphotransferase (APT) family kinase protein